MIPSIERARKLAEASKSEGYTIACQSCKQGLWYISNLQKYGTRWKSDKISFEGVGPYSDYWEADQKTAKKLECPHCGEYYLKAVQTNGLTFAVPYCPELEGL